MKQNHWRSALVLVGVGLVVAAAAWMRVPQAQAQCGSQASSCKNCHEVQGQMPVNTEGEWHTAHAFGDFCEFCHAGNVQATEADQAHVGMVDPLSDVEASCASCHPEDVQDRAQVYATALGVSIGGGGGGASEAGPSASGGSGEAGGADTFTTADLDVNDPNLVDYVERYREEVLGIKPINKPNLIAGAMIGLMLIGGGALIAWNEMRKHPQLRAVLEEIATRPLVEDEALRDDGCEPLSPEDAALLDALHALSPRARRDLFRLLEKPDNADELLRSLAEIDPKLIDSLRELDPGARSLLMAMSGD